MPTDRRLEDVCAARLPVSALEVLADLRRESGIRVRLAPASGDGVNEAHAWVHWDPGNLTVLRRLLPLRGIELYAPRDGLWYRPGAHLPSFGVPQEANDEAIPLARAVTPRPIEVIEAGGDDVRGPRPIRLGLTRARDETPRETTALLCVLTELGEWADRATTTQLAAIEAAWSGEMALLLGHGLPPLGGERFWGRRLLAPLGWRPDPDLPESTLLRALGVVEGEIVILEADGFEAIPRDAFQPLTRAGVRLARQEGAGVHGGGPAS
jgi:hypothetical protein